MVVIMGVRACVLDDLARVDLERTMIIHCSWSTSHHDHPHPMINITSDCASHDLGMQASGKITRAGAIGLDHWACMITW